MPIPIIAAVTGGAGIFGNWLSSRRSREEKQYTAGQTEAAREQSNLARLMGDFAKKQYALNEPAYNKALSYYSSLLYGNRAATNQLLQPERREIGDAYAGADLALERSGARGGVREQARADIARDRAGRIADVAIRARPAAAASLASLTGGGLDRAFGGLSGAGAGYAGAGYNYADLLGGERFRRAQNFQRMYGTGMSLAKLFLPYFLKGGAGGAGSAGNAGNALNYDDPFG